MNIIYGAGNSINSKPQLDRFLKAMKGSDHHIKIAAYKMSSPPNTNIDWTLDALLNPYKPQSYSLDSDNFQIFYDQIKSFKPDLIISDLEQFSSYIANQMNCTLWQYSSTYIYEALTDAFKNPLSIKNYYRTIMDFKKKELDSIRNMILNSDKNFICSHFGDVDGFPIKSYFTWIRPYHQIGKSSITCKHNIVASVLENDKPILNALNQHEDCVVFTEGCEESYKNIKIKHFDNQDEYYCNLKNCALNVNKGQTTFLSDAYYNGKFSALYLNYKDLECVTNGMLSQRFLLSSVMPINNDNLIGYFNRDFEATYQKDIHYIHEEIEKHRIYKEKERQFI